MSLITNLHGRLRNTSLPKSRGLMPLYDAVVNSIQAVEEVTENSYKGRIEIEIIRSPQYQLGLDDPKKKITNTSDDIIGFKVTDNGIGFNDANMRSFETLDSEHKAEKGGRGIGRLLWLKAFSNVKVESVYVDSNNRKKKRLFSFDIVNGINNSINEDVNISDPRKTIVHLDGFAERYQESSAKKVRAIANGLIEHCLWYFLRKGGAPEIIIHDEQDSVNLDAVLEEHMHSSSVSETIDIKGTIFDLTHVKLRSSAAQTHAVSLCAGNRLVKQENIAGKIPGLFGQIHDKDGDFIYQCYVCSEYLDVNVRPERTDFNISDDVDGLFSDVEISLGDIQKAVLEKAKSHLSDYLEENKLKGKERVDKFVAQKKPRYRPIMSRLPADSLIVDPSISDKDLDLLLHRHLSDIEEELLSEGHDLMKPMENENPQDYERRLQKYLNTASDIKKSDLANYVSHRRVIIDLLYDAIKKNAEGKHSREDFIHKLIMPMRKESNEIFADDYNLWLIDERLAFHDYLASDKTLQSMPITGSTEKKEPDIVVLNVFDNPILVAEGDKLPLASIEVIEIKRPMRDDAKEGEDKDPIEQALGYLEKIRNGTVQTSSGRQIPESKNIPGYCYILCDITPTIKQRTKIHQLMMTSDGLGYFGYNPHFNAYIEVISFDRLVNAAKERNRAFFDKLGVIKDAE